MLERDIKQTISNEFMADVIKCKTNSYWRIIILDRVIKFKYN